MSEPTSSRPEPGATIPGPRAAQAGLRFDDASAPREVGPAPRRRPRGPAPAPTLYERAIHVGLVAVLLAYPTPWIRIVVWSVQSCGA